jgi:hypothetical protein
MLTVYCQIHCNIQHMLPSESVIDTMPLSSVIVTCLCERIKVFCALSETCCLHLRCRRNSFGLLVNPAHYFHLLLS